MVEQLRLEAGATACRQRNPHGYVSGFSDVWATNGPRATRPEATTSAAAATNHFFILSPLDNVPIPYERIMLHNG